MPEIAIVSLDGIFGLLQELWQCLPQFALLEPFEHHILELLQIGFLVS